MRQFSLFQSHLDLAHHYWRRLFQEGALLRSSARVSAKRKVPNAVAFDKFIAEGSRDEEKDAAEGRLAAGRKRAQEEVWAVDATCGAGRDTLFIATCLKDNAEWGMISLDIQQEALDRTSALLDVHLSAQEKSSIHLIKQSHTAFPPIAYQHPIRLIVYNLGYLPGGDKNKTTQVSTTLTSVEAALNLLAPGGVISLTCYPGHLEGAREECALLERLSHLSPSNWSVLQHRALNRTASPSLILVQKKLD